MRGSTNVHEDVLLIQGNSKHQWEFNANLQSLVIFLEIMRAPFEGFRDVIIDFSHSLIFLMNSPTVFIVLTILNMIGTKETLHWYISIRKLMLASISLCVTIFVQLRYVVC